MNLVMKIHISLKSLHFYMFDCLFDVLQCINLCGSFGLSIKQTNMQKNGHKTFEWNSQKVKVDV